MGVMLLDPAGRVFAGQRIDSPGPAWQMPQGGIDAGEKPHAAALRELTEETGIPAESVEVVAKSRDWLRYDLPAGLVPRVWGGRFRGQEQRWFLMRFLGTDDQIDLATGHPEFSRWAWMAPEELVAQIVPFKRALYARVFDEFRPHLG